MQECKGYAENNFVAFQEKKVPNPVTHILQKVIR